MVAAMFVLVANAPAAQGASPDIVVTSSGDQADATPGDDTCATSGNVCTLRAAIETANQIGGPNTIVFNIAGSGPHTIIASTPLPDVNDNTGALTIDGYSQPGAAVNTDPYGSNASIQIEIQGNNSSTTLRITSKENTVRGLSFFGARINMMLTGTNADGNRLFGNFFGTNAAGTYENSIGVGGADTGVGVLLQLGASQNTIGAPTLADRNIISGNGGYGLRINHGESSENIIQNNVVGLNPQLTGKLRQWHGIDLQWWTWGNLVGGNGTLEGNLVGGQIFRAGIEFSHGATRNLAIGNRVGTMGDGNSVSSFSGNTYGIALKDDPRLNYVADNVIGGNGVGIWGKHNYTTENHFVSNRIGVGIEGAAIPNTTSNVALTGVDDVWIDNIIANNMTAQISITNYLANQAHFYYPSTTHGNELRQSQFHNNGSAQLNPYIDITPAGANLNDPGDGDSGVHDMLNYPEITGIGPDKVFGTACADCTIEVYLSAPLTSDGRLNANQAGTGTGLAWIGRAQASGSGAFSLADTRIDPGRTLSALAIDSAGNTSELPLGQIVPATHVGQDGSADASLGPVPAPAPPAMPRPYEYPEAFSCSYATGTLSWTDQGANQYFYFADGAYVGGTSTTSTAVPTATEYLVHYWASGTPVDATCDGPPPVTFACSYADDVLSWTDVGANQYFAFANSSYLGATSGLSISAPAAETYKVRYWSAGSPIDATCDGPPPTVFSCSFAVDTLTWTDVGANQYFAFADTTYLGGTTGLSISAPPASSYRVRHWVAGAPIDTTCTP